MDGPVDGPAEAFAKLALLNPLNTVSTSGQRPLATNVASADDSTAFVLLRPAAVKGALVSDICQRFEKRGLTLSAMRMIKPGADVAKRHYSGLALPTSELASLVGDLAPGPAVAMLWSGAGAIGALLAIAGNADPLKAQPGTVRGDLSAADRPDPLLEVAPNAAEVRRLTDIWFEPGDLSATAPSLAAAPSPAAPPPSAPAANAKPAIAAGKDAEKPTNASKAGKAGKAATAVDVSDGGSAAAAAPPPVDLRIVDPVKPPNLLPPKPIAALGRFYITTAINYANGSPHMGHAYEAIAADVLARYHKAYGREVYFLTGADEHGQKIADTAAAQGIKPIELVDRSVAQFKHLDWTLGCDFDGYVRTTSDAHKKLCRALWQKCVNKGDVYLGVYVGWYNVREETFVTESDASAADYKDPVTGKDLKKMEEPSYMFKMAQYQERILAHIRNHPEFIMPESRRNEVLERLAVPLQDLSVSRTTFDWGIAVPGDTPGHVMYVWFDALSNYITQIGYDALAADPATSSPTAKFWPCDCHLIGKDIIWFHCVIWPAMLMSAGLPLPKCVLAHGFVHGADGKKMSKSIGNVVDPYDVLARFPVDSFRFFIVRDAPFGGDLTFSETALALRHNSELADTFGNLVNRSLALLSKYTGGKIPTQAAEPNVDGSPVVDVGALRAASEAAYAGWELDRAAGLAVSALNATNKYLTDLEPWKMKEGDPRRLTVLRTVLEALYAVCHFLQPLLVHGVPKVFDKLNMHPVHISALKPTLDNLPPGHSTNASGGLILYDKVETAEALAKIAADAAVKKAAIEAAAKKQRDKAKAAASGVEESEFAKLDLRVGRIVEVTRHAEADALYVEKIDLGEGTPRQVVSGLVKFIPIEAMANRRVVCVANLKPTKLKGVESQAMVLCGKATDGSAMELVEPPEGVPLGERVTCEGHTDEPEKQLNPKKKIWEKLQPTLNTSDACVVRYEQLPFMTSKGPCTVQSLKGGAVG